MEALASTIAQLEVQATALRKSPPCDNTIERMSCAHREGKRPIDAEERRRYGYQRGEKPSRAFYMLDPRKLCNACAAWWHASMSVSVLRDLQRVALHEAAERERNAKDGDHG